MRSWRSTEWLAESGFVTVIGSPAAALPAGGGPASPGQRTSAADRARRART